MDVRLDALKARVTPGLILRTRTSLKRASVAALCVLVFRACGSESAGRPGHDTSTTTASPTTTFGQLATVPSSASSTTAPPTTRSTLEPPLMAGVSGRQLSLRRTDLTLAANAPATLVASSPQGVVVMGWRGVGCCRPEASAAFSIDGRQLRTVDTPWTFQPSDPLGAGTYGFPTALAYADGMFLSVGRRGQTGSLTNTAFAARSQDGINWEAIDLHPAIGPVWPEQLVRFGDRWVMMAQPTDTSPARQTVVFGSTDGVAWDRLGQLDFVVQRAAAFSQGLVVAGSAGEGNSTMWFSAVSTNTREWNTTKLPLGPTSPVHSMFLDSPRMVLVVSEDTSGSSRDRRIRLLSSVDGVEWQSASTPPCFARGELAVASTVTNGTWAIVTGDPTPRLATSIDKGESWSCTELRGEPFESQPSWGPPYITQLTELQGTLALVGGRLIEPGAKANWAAAIWYAM